MRPPGNRIPLPPGADPPLAPASKGARVNPLPGAALFLFLLTATAGAQEEPVPATVLSPPSGRESGCSTDSARSPLVGRGKSNLGSSSMSPWRGLQLVGLDWTPRTRPFAGDDMRVEYGTAGLGRAFALPTIDAIPCPMTVELSGGSCSACWRRTRTDSAILTRASACSCAAPFPRWSPSACRCRSGRIIAASSSTSRMRWRETRAPEARWSPRAWAPV